MQEDKVIASHASWTNRNAPWRDTFCIFALLSILVAAPAFLMMYFLDIQLVLPALSILLFLDAIVTALFARANSENETLENVTLWDIAGAFTMMGCAAAILGEPDQVALFFEQPVEQHPGTPAVGDSHQAP
ncbi:hypothetical protein ACVWWG_006394 [Bradyrhizobium sp. LB7.2]|jgi:hypothetical protein|uniref:hypothetical protein n=1 Tax=Bradyrhizobium sp. LB14.3 TaxID=3156328 RepID=UPI00339849C8